MEGGGIGRVFQPGEGEVLHLRPPRDGSRVTILVDPVSSGPTGLDVGLQEIDPGRGIPVHLHQAQDEVLFFTAGSGTALLGEARVPVSRGSAVYVPRGTWHGVENSGSEPLALTWVISPPGLTGFFRAIGGPGGAGLEPLTDREVADAARRSGMLLRSIDGASR